MQLTTRSLILLLFTMLPIGASSIISAFLWMAVAWLILILFLFAVDLYITPGVASWGVTRHHDDRLSLAAQNRIDLHVHLRRSSRPLLIWIRDVTPESFGIAEEERILHGTVTPGQPQTFTYYLRPPRRGDYEFGDLYLRWESVLGLLRRQGRFDAVESVKVYPNLVDVKKYDLLVRKNRLWDLGLRNAKIFGSGTEFERLRDYLPDDEFRRINWKATARRGKPISVEYETERSQNIMTVLDTGRMMRSPVGDVAKIDYAINAVLLLAYVAAQKGDKVGLLSFADNVETWLAPRGGKGQFHRMLEVLYRMQSQSVEPDYNQAFGYLAARQSKRSLVLVFTDLTGSISTETLVAQMMRLQKRHLALLVTLRDPTVQNMATQAISDSASLYQRTVAEQLLDERSLTLDRLQRRGVLTLDVAANELSMAVINRYLELKARTMI
ncbi:DUF58 domain-containing protein [Chloroflexi bacterium TSY]|nr:DUF58 domain-containing protein [Chloroflexi bacterium TSY]